MRAATTFTTTPLAAWLQRQPCFPRPRKPSLLLNAAFVLIACLARGDALTAAEPLGYNRDIRPLLADKCFACHGPDEGNRQADLRLDIRASALKSKAIVPGKPDASELVRRVFSTDSDERMPPDETGRPLTGEQKRLLRRWIAEGAEYEQHWAFVPPRRPPLPPVKDAGWPRNEIDRFVLARLVGQGLRPSPEADRYTLARRLFLDLIGLPPSPEEADAFVRDTSPDAYERLAERLLASPRYGEHWARGWLDLARYADTNGYEKDRPRPIWPYRDWVICALNRDLPFDQFSVEQLAGDMLPDATLEQRVATGFHRNTMLNEEGGIDPLEFRFYAMVDRVATTGTVWLGLTVGCAQCHTHKYDPISHTDYYRFMALLNNADEPDMSVPSPAITARRTELKAEIARLQAELPRRFPAAPGEEPVAARRRQALDSALEKWLRARREIAGHWRTLKPQSLQSNLPRLTLLDDGSVLSQGDITKRDVFKLRFQLDQLDQPARPITALRLEALPDERLPAGGPGRAFYEGRKGDFFLSEVTARYGGRPLEFKQASHSFGKISIGRGTAEAANVIDGKPSTGWSTSGREGEAHQLVLQFAEPVDASGELEIEMLFERHFAASLGRFRIAATSDDPPAAASETPVALTEVLARDPSSWTGDERSALKAYFLTVAPQLAEARRRIDALRKTLPEFPTTLVLQERPADNPRPTFRHHRGEYLSPREPAPPGIPRLFAPLTDAPPGDRLALARWLVSDGNPLVGRVTVNRAWRTFFGVGLVQTSGDFGTLCEAPSHPQLLDWLACEFVERGWSLKRLHRLIVTSATYRQASHGSRQNLQRDPHNRWLSRGASFRVDAEMVRDIPLQASGLLSSKMLGPSVYPPQPESVAALAYGGAKWTASRGEDRYRRSLYTFRKRTAPFAAYGVFDAPSGENCVARRDRSNTPLQALTLLNDAMFLEAARSLALAAMRQDGDARRRATFVFRRLLTRPPEPAELDALLQFQQNQFRRLASGELKAEEIAGAEHPDAETASWVMVARVVMNLDETISRH